MVARLAYENFLKAVGGEHYRHQDGNKTTLQSMRNLFFEKRNYPFNGLFFIANIQFMLARESIVMVPRTTEKVVQYPDFIRSFNLRQCRFYIFNIIDETTFRLKRSSTKIVTEKNDPIEIIFVFHMNIDGYHCIECSA